MVLAVSIPNRDLCKLQPEIPSRACTAIEVSIPNRDLCKLQLTGNTMYSLVNKFQSLIGICVSCNVYHIGFLLASSRFQSLIGICVSCNGDCAPFGTVLHRFQSLIGICVSCNSTKISAPSVKTSFNP